MRKFLVAAMGSALALVGFAGPANASATLDLIWIDVTDSTCINADRRDCPQIGTVIASVLTSENITLAVIVTAGPGGYVGGQMSVDYSDALPAISVVDFRRLLTTFPKHYLPIDLSNNGIRDTGTRIETMLTTASPFAGAGIGLPPYHTAYIGTVTFHKDVPVNDAVEISVDTQGLGDALGNLGYEDISATSTYNSAYLTNSDSTPTPTATPTATPIPTATSTPTATPIPTPTPVPTAPPTWPRQRGAPPPDLSCLCEIENINPNQVVLKNVGTGGKGSETTRTIVMNLTAVDGPGGTCGPGEFSDLALVNLKMVDDDGDVLVDRPEPIACEGGGVTTTLKWDVLFQGPLNCENGAVPPSKPGFSTGSIAITGAAPLTPYYYESTRIKCFE